MRIAHIINTLDLGGAQTVLLQLVRAWQWQDQHTIISLRKGNSLDATFEQLGVKVIHTGLNPFRIAKALRSTNPHMIQTWLYHSDLIGSLAGRWLLGVPVIWGVHHTTSNPTSVRASTYRIIQLLAKMSTSYPGKIICCSRSAYDTHIALGYDATKMVHIENGIDTVALQPVAGARQSFIAELNLPPEAQLIGMFARFNPQKDHRTFIEAAKILSATHPNAHFILAGDQVDDQNQTLTDHIQQTQLGSRLHLLGARHDIPRLLSAMDVVTLTSAFGEAMPMILLEAICCNAPCVATDVGDIPLLLQDGGVLTKIGDAAAIAAAWAEVLAWSPATKQQMNAKAHQTVTERYGIEKMCRQYHDLYLSLF